MKTLCFAEYAKIMIKAIHESNESTVNDLFSIIIEKAKIKYRSGEEFRATKETVSRLLSRKDDVPNDIILGSKLSDVHNSLIEYFREFLVKKMLPEAVNDTIHKLKDLISEDDTISPDQKAELLDMATRDTLAEFLSKTFLYSLTKPNKPRIDNSATLNNLPHHQNQYFTGREEKLDSIEKNFQSGDRVSLTQSVTGLGGIGKTSIALEYAYRHFDEYETIWWVNAENEQAVLNAYGYFCVKKKIVPPDAKSDEITAAVKNWFNSKSNIKWLFIYDNADADDFGAWFDQYLPQKANKGHVIITTRSSYFPQSTPVNIDIFTEDEAVRFLKRRIQKEGNEFSEEWAKKLAYRLGYFPLALEQAAAYICVNPTVTYKKYIEAVEKYLDKSKNLTNYDKTVYATLRISIEKIPKGSAARQMFNMCSYFAPDRIPIDIFVEGNKVLPKRLRANISKIDDIVGELTKYSLLKCEDDFLYMHRLVQEVAHRNFAENTVWLLYCLLLMCGVVDWKRGDKTSIDRFKIESPHVITIAEKSSGLFIDEELLSAIGWLFNNIGMVYADLGEYGQALEHYNKALAIIEKVYVNDQPDTAAAYNNVGGAYAKLGGYERALEYYSRALAIYIKVYGDDHPETAMSYNNIGGVYSDLDEYERALEYHSRALAIFEKVYGNDHSDTAASYGNIGVVYSKLGKYERALEYYNRALTIFEKVYGNEHPDTAAAYSDIGLAYFKLGEYERALEYHSRALAILEKVYGDEHPDTAMSYNNVGGAYAHLGEYERALEYYNRALTIFVKMYGDDHPATITVKNNINEVLYLIEGS